MIYVYKQTFRASCIDQSVWNDFQQVMAFNPARLRKSSRITHLYEYATKLTKHCRTFFPPSDQLVENGAFAWRALVLFIIAFALIKKL